MSQKLTSIAAIVLLASGCAIVNRDHLDQLEGMDAGADVDSGPETDAGVDAGGDGRLTIPTVDLCGNDSSTYYVFDDSTNGQVRIDTRGHNSQITDCGPVSAPGNDGFIAVEAVAGIPWHFHLTVDPSVAGQDRNPFLYLLPQSSGGCDSRACTSRADDCMGDGEEHFAFVPTTTETYYLGIDDRNAGGGVYLLNAIRLECDDGLEAHGEACDGSDPGRALPTVECDRITCQYIFSADRDEVEPNDNVVEANELRIPASNRINISGRIGESAQCVRPDVFTVSMTEAAPNLTVRVAGCGSGAETPYDLVLRSADGVQVEGGQVDSVGCATIEVTNLAAGTYQIWVEHDAPLERGFDYRLAITRSAT